MSADWDPQRLIEPVVADRPCGENLDDSDGLSSLDAFQVFGQASLDPEPKDPADAKPLSRESRPSDRPPNWQAIKELSLDALARTRDFRPLAHLGAAVLRTNGLPAFCETLKVGATWIESYWSDVYPRLEDGMIPRRSALNCFADRAAMIEGLRRAPILSSREHGRVSLRDCDIAAGQLPANGKDVRSEEARIAAAFGSAVVEDLEQVRDSIASASTALAAMDATMRKEAGVEAALDLDPLSKLLAKAAHLVQSQLALRTGNGADAETPVPGSNGSSSRTAGVVGPVRSREDAIRALDAVADFFRHTEPSSPVPLFVERAKRLVSKDFLEVLADVAPGALNEARQAGGVRQQE